MGKYAIYRYDIPNMDQVREIFSHEKKTTTIFPLNPGCLIVIPK